jgi:hypothetical protein
MISQRFIFNLNEIIREVQGLNDLVSTFTNEEIDIVKNLPSGKPPGLDGFIVIFKNFMKKCYKDISPDFYGMCRGLYNNNICMQSINGSYIVLVPKVDNKKSE